VFITLYEALMSFLLGALAGVVAKVLGASQKMFSADGKIPSDGPTNVLETLKAADTQTELI